MLEGLINTNYHGEFGLLLHSGDSKGYNWKTEDPLGCLLMLKYTVTKVNGTLQ